MSLGQGLFKMLLEGLELAALQHAPNFALKQVAAIANQYTTA